MAESTLVIRAAQDAGATVHWLPVKTNHSGPCKVDEFFQPQLIEEAGTGNQALEAHLRGRTLRGCTRQLPDGFAGVVVAPSAPSSTSSAEERVLCSSATFSKLTYWNHDTGPAASDGQARTLDWLKLAEKVQVPISQQELQEELQQIGQK